MAHFSGINLAVCWGTAPITSTDLAGHGRTVDVDETAPAPKSIDVTHKGDTAEQIIEGLPGAPEYNVSYTALVDDTWELADTMALNTQATLYVFPRGKTHNYPMLTIGGARLHDRKYAVPYADVVSRTMTFNSKVSLVHTTYASA